jgi:hypothetical protein
MIFPTVGVPSGYLKSPTPAICDTGTRVTTGTALATTAWAALRYFSISRGDMFNTSAMLSKP